MTQTSNKRILKNSVFLYARMAIIMVVNLYMVRLVLNTLGVVDYGVYDVVAGVVLLFQSVSSVLSLSTQRYFSYALGEGNKEKIALTYSSSIYVFLFFSVIVLQISESIGLWFLNNYLDIPDNRMAAANWVYQFSILSFILIILQIPFSSAVIAYEDMDIFSIISLGECFLKLLSVVLLAYLQTDKLILYGLFLMLVSLIALCAYMIVVVKKYDQCRFNIKSIGQWRELLTFAGWTMFGSVASVSITQVCTFLVNIFFGPVVNAARAIAFQVSHTLNSFCGNFLMAVRPPMIKAYAEEQYDYLNKLFICCTKLVFYGMLMVFIPLYLDMEYILGLWLKTSDPQTVLFSRLMLIYTFILVLGNPITIIMHATGYVKQYHIVVEIPTLAVMPFTYLFFKLGFPAESTYMIAILAIILSHFIRLGCLNRYYPYYSISNYFLSFVFGAIFVTVAAYLALKYVQSLCDDNFPGFSRINNSLCRVFYDSIDPCVFCWFK